MTKRVNLIGTNLDEVPQWVLKDQHLIGEMELTSNRFSQVAFLRDFHNLTTLVLDKNSIASHVTFPYLPNLKLLWLNSNKIENISLFYFYFFFLEFFIRTCIFFLTSIFHRQTGPVVAKFDLA